MRSLSTTLALVLSCAFVAGVHADMLAFEMSVEYSEGVPPAGPSPWLTAVFDDGGTPGSVELFIEATNLVDVELVNVWMFNLDPLLDPTQLVFSTPIKTGQFQNPDIWLGVDAHQAGGDGLFDIALEFDESNQAGRRFGAGEAALYTITGIPTLTASSFDFLSNSGGHGGYPSAAQVGGISPNDGSGWITVPEPTALSALVVIGLAMARRRR
jgi:hypothetical protein